MPTVELKQDAARLRMVGYPTSAEQRGAFAKILRVLIDASPPEVVKLIPADALAVLEGVEEVKRKFPKEGRKLRKPKK